MDKKNLLIVGAGGHAYSWKLNIETHPGWRLMGIVDTDMEKLDRYPKMWGFPEENAFPTMTDAVRWVDEDIDTVLIATPIPTHHGLATEALELGLNVILEKNMATTIQQGQALVKLARKHPELGTAMGTQYRFRPTWWTLRQLFSSPECPIGKVSHFQMRSSAGSGDQRTGWRAFLPHIYADDMMVHHVDLLRYTMNMDIIKVQARVFKPSWSRWHGTSTVFMNFVLAPKGKELEKDEWVFAQYTGDWQGTGLKAGWEDTIEFFGSKGSVRFEPPAARHESATWMGMWSVIDGNTFIGEPAGSTLVAYIDDEKTRKVITKDIERRLDIENTSQEHFDQKFILEQMYQCIESKGKKQPGTNFEDGFKSFLVTRAAILSSETGKDVWLPDYWLEPVPAPRDM